MGRNHQRLDRRRWAVLRRVILDRDNWRCRECGRAGRIEVDHIKPLKHGGDPWDPANLQTLCVTHHILKSKGESQRPDPERDRWTAYINTLVSPPQI